MSQFRGHTASQLRSMQKEIAEELGRFEYDKLQPGIPMQQESAGQANAMGRGLSSDEIIDHVFTFHDNPGAVPHYVEVREAAKVFAKVICRHAPDGADKVTSVTKIREAVMFANAAIALGGRGL